MSAFDDFRRFLDDNDYVFSVKEDGDYPHIRFNQQLSNTSVTVLLVFKDDFIKIFIHNITNISDHSKIPEIVKLVNDFNRQYNFFKFYLDSDDDFIVENDVNTDINEGDFDARNFMGLVVAGFKIIEQIYPKLMKTLWA